MTEPPAFGTALPDQLPAVSQSLLSAPLQVSLVPPPCSTSTGIVPVKSLPSWSQRSKLIVSEPGVVAAA
jgi:hypothetical protein